MAEGAALRVVVWSTGGIGSIAVRAVAENPSTELVGVWVHSADKVGRDVGEIVGIGPIGVTATNDADELIALHPDCVVYAASGPEPTTQLQEVTVTAQYREEKLQDIPIAITAITAQQIEQQGAQKLSDILTSAPSVVLTSFSATPDLSTLLRSMSAKTCGTEARYSVPMRPISGRLRAASMKRCACVPR